MAESETCEASWSIFSISPEIPAGHLSEALTSPSAIRYAYDMGVLEVLALSLTVLGVSIAVVAVIGYWIYGHIVDRAAKRETKQVAPDVISDILRKDPQLWVRVIRENPETFRSAIREAMADVNTLDKDMADSSADDIAAHAAGDANDKPS